jgi:aminomethyltransferase
VTAPTDTHLLETPLTATHRELGARMMPFAGYSMPVQYAGIKKEHAAVREAAGLFDVSHMGELFLEGPHALGLADSLVTNDVSKLEDGQALYTVCCNEKGTILDDLIVYRLAPERVMIVCNASNRAKISAHVAHHAGDPERQGKVRFKDASDDYALLALQGPKAETIMGEAGGEAFTDLGFFRVREGELLGAKVIVARTGYTGEDGFELFVPVAHAKAVWDGLMKAGESHGLQPVGLGARDTLRLEAKLALYGNDIDETTHPYEAGLGWVVKLDGADFLGKAALAKIKKDGFDRKLVGFEMTGRGIGRHGYPILDPESGEKVGEVTSGSPAPTLGKNIGLGYVPKRLRKVGTPLQIEIRGKRIDARVVKTPFYKREK